MEGMGNKYGRKKGCEDDYMTGIKNDSQEVKKQNKLYPQNFNRPLNYLYANGIIHLLLHIN
jgi:hypothetical protein